LVQINFNGDVLVIPSTYIRLLNLISTMVILDRKILQWSLKRWRLIIA